MANIYEQYGKFPTFTPQTVPIPGREAEMEPNNAGGFGFKLDDWERLSRFLILGSEGGTYYVGQRDLTKQNADAAIRCIKEDGIRAVEFTHHVNVKNLAPKVDSQLFVMALALKHGDQVTKDHVGALMPAMLRTGTHVLHFAAMLDALGGWNRTKRRIVGKWFSGMDAEKVAYQAVKYRQRDGWAMRDLLRVAHPAAPTPEHQAVYNWLCGRPFGDNAPAIIRAAMTVALDGDPVERALFGIQQGLPREALPTEALRDPRVISALLPTMPLHALIRNLGSLSSEEANLSATVDRLRDRVALAKSRVHPFAIMLAAAVYATGHGVRGGKTWTPQRAVIEALDDAYEAASEAIQPTGKRLLIAIDGSGSMSHGCIGTPLPCEDAAKMIALTLARTEPYATVVVFEERVREIVPITKRSSLSSIQYQCNPAGTDLGAPIRWAMEFGGYGFTKAPKSYDAFVLLTDNETWKGHGHTTQWMAEYRRKMNPKAKLIVAAFAANGANVVDPDDPGQLGVAGLDANLPSIMAEFIGR